MTAADKRLMRLLKKKYGRQALRRGTTVGPTASIKKQLGTTQVSRYAKDGGYIVKKRKKTVKKRKK
jgi:hypothetical protein